MNIKNKLCNVLDTNKKGYITVGDVGIGFLWVGIYSLFGYILYKGVFMFHSFIFEPSVFDGIEYECSFDMFIGMFGVALITFGFMYLCSISFLALLKVRVITCKKEK